MQSPYVLIEKPSYQNSTGGGEKYILRTTKYVSQQKNVFKHRREELEQKPIKLVGVESSPQKVETRSKTFTTRGKARRP